jgi:hypothetical protein
MTINFDPGATPTNQFGTFHSFFDVFFDVRLDSLNGPIVATGELPLTGDAPWTHQAPPDVLLLPGINFLLNGNNNFNDFWPGPLHNGPHLVDPTPTPEPSTVIMAGAGALGLIGFGWRRSRRKAA